jgi:endonuclease/exonuclease/phosphatase (EEP) superfamily protein YafD
VPPATLILALACLLLSLAAQGGRWSGDLDVLAQFAPVWLVMGAASVAAAFSGRGRQRWIAAGAGALTLASAASLMAPEWLRPDREPPAAPAAVRLRVIQINIGGDGVRDPDRAAAWLEAQRPDVVFLNDWDPPMRAAMQRHGFFWRKGTAWTAIATRQPFLPPPFPFSMRDWSTMPDVARARLVTASGPVDLVGAHLARPLPGDPLGAGPALARLQELARRYDQRRLILSGDLNLTPWSFALRRFDRRLGLQRRDRAVFSWPARTPWGGAWPIPLLPLDHVYAGSSIRTLRIVRGPPIGAAHYPVVADLEVDD